MQKYHRRAKDISVKASETVQTTSHAIRKTSMSLGVGDYNISSYLSVTRDSNGKCVIGWGDPRQYSPRLGLVINKIQAVSSSYVINSINPFLGLQITADDNKTFIVDPVIVLGTQAQSYTIDFDYDKHGWISVFGVSQSQSYSYYVHGQIQF